MLKFRFSKKPEKQLLWMLLKRDAKLSYGRLSGLDAGGANMKNKIFFHTRDYTCLDPDLSMLQRGMSKYPDARIVNCTILEAPECLTADFVQCIQVFVNSDFDTSETIETVKKLSSMVRAGGTLLLNTGEKTIQYDQRIFETLKKEFKFVERFEYGKIGPVETNFMYSFVLALLSFTAPKLFKPKRHQKTYFRCTQRV